MATLITGGGSQIGLRLAQLLGEFGKPVIFASRSGSRIPEGAPHVKFDWDDPSTFEAPFSLGQKIDYVYILGPSDYDPLPKAKPFIDLAVAKGVKRFIALSASGDHTEKGPGATEMGRVHTYLHDQGLDYVALRPTWFTENIARFYGHGIKANGLIQNVVEKGPVAFVAVEDIAQTAFKAITDVESLRTREPFLVGPDLVSYQDVVAILSEVLGREITYKVISVEDQIALYRQLGLSEEFAPILANIEKALDDGADLRTATDPRAIKGKVGVREWIEKNKGAFI
ncbi:NAD(P)-binding protein [Coprinellus micaceus]|uniref:NAD(P)-binding protein n=1 Tax=Coprinellus micaceus TaxID=71717 RepID=A0A4Y7SXX5_COPMI|nr:NAD(P)-binding protein [Coprinellus micaceus]